MKKQECMAGAMSCIGAVIGAGFASGREVVSFFTQYGVHGWWLIGLTVAVMVGLMLLCMRRAGEGGCWYQLYCGMPKWRQNAARVSALLLMTLTAGAMISAAGHMVALVWPSGASYAVGLFATALLAYWAGYGKLRALSWISTLLAVLLFLAVLLAMGVQPAGTQQKLLQGYNAWQLLWAAIRAIAYAAMNMTLAMGVVCRCGCYTRRGMSRTCILFGYWMMGLLFLSHALYLRCPQLAGEAFPIVKVLSFFGRWGFLLSAALMYLAIFTTLTAVVYGLRTAAADYVSKPAWQLALALGLPLALSSVGFETLVNQWYAPAGLGCLFLVFAPLLRKNPLDNSRKIQ